MDPYMYFWLFGLINNVLYVVILSAAVDLIGPSSPKSLVLLADILPSLAIKLICPFFVDKISYPRRVVALIITSFVGMLLVSASSLKLTITGIVLASLSSGFGEVTFLQLTHVFPQSALNGWSSGTGAAGLLGTSAYMFLTSICRIRVTMALLLFAVMPFAFLLFFKLDTELIHPDTSSQHRAHLKLEELLYRTRGLVIPYMLPLTSVYLFEYMINQAISPTLLFPLGGTDRDGGSERGSGIPFFFKKYRDIYVTYSTLYQLGVYISRSSGKWIRIKHLYLLSHLQALNFVLALIQSWLFVVKSPWPVMFMVFYEGLLGGASYVNTFLNVSDDIDDPKLKEFALGTVSIADSSGIFVAALLGLPLEPALCKHQLADGRPWCRME
ncbi:amino acid transporter YHC3 KNAG_0B05330 [Huiozyma naganishii CBS 8797]|uniref:Protein BTN n=1 Tax=Huiozyma naganishii (strain ATCC MYA-139 / BCRC 22969 / CBS 8797 / KCTC 17520 / NBRC 10181 / NCYC 3082 / Yp74L-3) TaxID=1071383 RepID=J7S569_HUIN7|nr:hypothetical protein KNAG_0B05330 [Kazachstania naganishii CBS 8797]CCK68966.1 hypothetical protein KNAG_0B05330 [Kazachstania naganishii CBS 8797]